MAAGTVIQHTLIANGETTGQVFLGDILAESGNENADFGDEVVKIHVYKDAEHTNLIDTCSVIL